jgi:hypothetical protein
MVRDDVARARVAPPAARPRRREDHRREARADHHGARPAGNGAAPADASPERDPRDLPAWHAAHRPVAITAFIAVTIHVVVVVAVGATWF